MNRDLDEVYRFGPYSLMPAQRMLVDADGPVRLGSRALDVLVALVERAGDVVSKEELLATVWRGRVVDDGSLRVHVSALRKALGDGRGGQRFIHSVPLRGYSFVAPVRRDRVGDAPSVPAARPGWSGLPLLRSRVTGRDGIVAELVVEVPRRRLVTLVGPGGIGKTTVALAAAHTLADRLADPSRHVDLGPVADPAHVFDAVATALGILRGDRDPLGVIEEHLRERTMLLVLDTCEHVIDAVAVLVERILGSAPRVCLLATSREPLRVQGEWLHRLPPLDVPTPDLAVTAASSIGFAAVDLFIERAMAAHDSFELSDANAPLVAAICRQLDGIPLAIELAAAQVSAFSLQSLSDRLVDRLTLLHEGRRTALARHQTLRAALDWSHELLPTSEQVLLRSLSAFKGGFDLDAAIAIGGAAEPPEHGAGAAISEVLFNLVAKSLVVADVSLDWTQYRLLDTTRAYAGAKLKASPERREVQRRHAAHLLNLLRSSTAHGAARPDPAWMERHRGCIDDVRSALNWALSADGDVALAVQIAAASAPLLFALSLPHEFRRHAELALSLISDRDATFPTERMQLLEALGNALWHTNAPLDDMTDAFERAASMSQRLGSTRFQMRSLWGLWAVANNQGRYEAALDTARRFGELARSLHDEDADVFNARMLALSNHFKGDQATARRLAEQVIAHGRPANRLAIDVASQFDQLVVARTTLARVLWLQGFPRQALAQAVQAADEARHLDHGISLCYTLTGAGCPIALWNGARSQARAFVAQLLESSSASSLAFWHERGKVYELMLELPEEDPCLPQAWRARSFDASNVAPLAETMASIHAGFATQAMLRQAVAGARHWCTPELLRIHGQLLLREDPVAHADAALAYFRSAGELAREQGALAWELRAATSLAAVLRTREAVERLEAIRGRFESGASSLDLKVAGDLVTALQA